jgi:hypothetical protein
VTVKAVHLIALLALLAADVPPVAVTPSDIVFEATFESLDAQAADRDEPLEGQLSGDGTLLDGGKLRLDANARLRFDDPTMIDLRRGAVSMDLSLNFDMDDAPAPLHVLWCLQGTGDPRYMARLYLLTGNPTLVFGVYQHDERTWLYMVKTPIRWKPDEPHNVTVAWGGKTSLIVDGRIVSIARSEGLLTDAMLPDAVDLNDARLFVGPEVGRLSSGFTADRFEIRNQTFRFADEEMD